MGMKTVVAMLGGGAKKDIRSSLFREGERL
jgi:hypothetical protein